MVAKGTFEVTCLADGTVRIVSGSHAGVSHKLAEDFVAELQRELGGSVKITKGHTHVHEHDHNHDHDHE